MLPVWRVSLVGLIATVALAQTPAVAQGGVLNAASFTKGQPVTPGSLVSIFGTNLASGLSQAGSIPLSTALGDVTSVTFNNIVAPLLFVSPGQINAQLPWEVPASGTATVVVNRATGSSAPASLQVGSASPGIFSVQFGVGQAIAINLDSSLAAPVGSIPGIPTHPAKAGDTIVILGTGLGAVSPPAQTGNSSLDALRSTTATPVILIGGVPSAAVPFSGLTPQFVGVNQINVVVPQGAPVGDKVPLQIQLGGITTTDQVTVAISQ